VLLSDLHVFDRLTTEKSERRITIEPVVNLRRQLGPSSLDIHLGYEFRVFKYQQYTHLEPFATRHELRRDLAKYTELVAIQVNPNVGRFILHPGEFALASTLEFIGLPDDIAARVEGRSSWGRLGLQVHSTAGFIDPGFSGTVTYELSNVGRLPIPLYVGLRVGQLAFFEVSCGAVKPYGSARKYHGQFGPRESRFYEDEEFDVLSTYVEDSRVARNIDELERLNYDVIPGSPDEHWLERTRTKLVSMGYELTRV
jgi:dCTP deaminase